MSVRLEALTMQVGKTFVGAIIGAALGIGLLIAVYLLFGIDKMWMAIPVALLTGLGVRMVASTSGHASYLRGAITVLLAMGAYLGGLAVTKAVANHRSQTVSKQNPAHVASEPGEPKAEEPAANAPPVDVAPIAPVKTDSIAHRPAMPQQFSTWDFISLAVAALLAYELGRGTGGVRADAMDAGPSEPVPGTMHPDA
jgi:ABC-type antimicrobial peptide transport system permease subunit